MVEAAKVEARDPDTMSVEDLRAEVGYWREGAAASLFFLLGDLERGRSGDFRSRMALKQQVKQVATALGDALAGKLFPDCFSCAAAIQPGMAVLCDVNEGEMHACCEEPWRIKPGEAVKMDPEGIVWEGEGPKPDHIVAHAAERLYTTAQLAENVGRAFALLAGSKAA